jgi:hypothetical protein
MNSGLHGLRQRSAVALLDVNGKAVVLTPLKIKFGCYGYMESRLKNKKEKYFSLYPFQALVIRL